MESKDILRLSFVGLVVLMVVLVSVASVECGPLFCHVKYNYMDERCEECCNKNNLISSSSQDGACECVESVANEFKRKFPAVTSEQTKLEQLQQH